VAAENNVRISTLCHDLADPGTQIVHTHISLVLLGAGEVWKIKKPVDFGFLNFTTLQARREACEAEVELNRRLAPDVYLGVVAITRDADGRLRLRGEGAPVEWAVHMRRLRDADRADVRVAEGRLSRADLTQVASKLAAFHAQARSDEHTASFGDVKVIERNVLENFAQTRETVTHHVTPEQAAEIERWQRSFLRDQAETIASRVATGRVRDGHGDLRLEHVYLDDDGEVRIIDCIEFNERFRYADVAADIAFLAMDLARVGHVELAEHFVAAYARAAQDYDLYAVLDFYESYRAYVRAKITSLLAEDPEVDSPTRERASLETRLHYLLALASERRSLLEPQVVAVGGVIASGKSTIAEHLASELSAPIVDADRTRKHMLGVRETEAVLDGSWSGAYDPAFTDEVYAEVFRRAAVVLESGRPVVIDASFRSRALRQRARELAEVHGVSFRFVECSVEPDVSRARLRERARGRSVSDGRLEIFDAFVRKWEPVQEIPADQHLVLDTSRSIDVNVEHLRRHMATWPRGLHR
jgi:uncharacterized protein